MRNNIIELELGSFSALESSRLGGIGALGCDAKEVFVSGERPMK